MRHAFNRYVVGAYERIMGRYPAGWNDIIGQVVVRVTGPSNPTWKQMGASPFYGWAFSVGDSVQVNYHFNHDMSFNQRLDECGLYLHAHWMASGTDTNTVKWQFTYTMAKAFAQGSVFDIAGGGTTVDVEEAATGTAWEHMTSEIASPVSLAGFEPDTTMMCRVTRVTNGGTDNANDIFMDFTDGHYQVERMYTKNRTPDFYA